MEPSGQAPRHIGASTNPRELEITSGDILTSTASPRLAIQQNLGTHIQGQPQGCLKVRMQGKPSGWRLD